MSIAILAWGSLVWKGDGLRIAGPFTAEGPHLPFEFSRISRDGSLTLVIDEKNGVSCISYVAVSVFEDLDAAVENLRVREGMPSRRGVGFIDLHTGKQSPVAVERHPRAVEAIKNWLAASAYTAAIWTALASNFHEPDKANERFSIDAALRYLQSLDTRTRSAALNYIRQAPPEVQTPLRAAVSERWPEE